MLVLLGPPFEGTDQQYAALARATGLVPYDLKTRVRPGHWSAVRALADAAEAELLAERLRESGFRAVCLDPAVGHEPARALVALKSLEFGEQTLNLRFHERQMEVPFAALCVIVRGEIHLGGRPATRARASSSSTFRAVVPSADELATPAAEFDAFAGADLHFHTVAWFCRIDSRSFDFGGFAERTGNALRDLELLIERLAAVSGARIDRGHRTSSIISFVDRGAAGQRTSVPPTSDERFDAYSRIVGEAERRTPTGAPNTAVPSR